MPGASQGAIRQLAGGGSPRLRLGERDGNAGSLGLRGSGAVRPVARREPQLKLGLARIGSRARRRRLRPGRARLGRVPGQVRQAARGRARRLAARRLRRPPHCVGLALRTTSGGLRTTSGGLRTTPGRLRIASGGPGAASGRLRTASGGLGGARFGRSSLGRSLLGGSVFSRSAPLGRSSPFRHRGNLARPAGGGLAGRAPRFSRGSPLARLTGAQRGPAGGSGIKGIKGVKSPGRGWLRRTSSPGAALSRGSSLARASSLGRSSPGRRSLLGRGAFGTRGAFGRRRAGRRLTGTSRLRMPRPKAKRSWRTGGYR